jgi:dihydroorotate dehydrogenase (NAD+) catalytic subunit
MAPDLSVSLGPVQLRHPVVCGSGEHLASEAGLRAAIDAGAAAAVAKSANETPAGRDQWTVRRWTLLSEDWRELPAGTLPRSASLMNRSGLAPTPWDEWLTIIARADARARERDAWVLASVVPGDERELPRLAAEVEQAGIRWLELNLSAPHAGEGVAGAIERPDSPERVSELTRSVRARCGLPLTVKLTAESADVVALARAARESGADSIAMTGRHLGFLPDLRTRRPVLGTFGAISGSWSLPLTLRWIAKSRLALGAELPIVGSNGARDGDDVARFLLAGASAVQLATVVFLEGWGAIRRIVDQLESYLVEAELDARDLIGDATDHVLAYAQVDLSPRPEAP